MNINTYAFTQFCMSLSPDLAACDFYLFPNLKSKLKGHHFGTTENIQKIVTDELNTLNGK